MKKRIRETNLLEDKTDLAVTVLVTEDDENLNRLIQKILQKAGVPTRQALNGAEAVAKATENPNQIILLDYKLPDMDGRKVIEILARRQKKIPFIIMTGYGDEKTAVEMMKLGASDYIVKDLEFMQMIPFVVKRILKDLEKERRLVKTEKEKIKLEEQLHHTQKMEALGQLAGGVAHDFNNILSGMSGYAYVLKTLMDPSPEKLQYLENITDCVRRAGDLTAQLLAFARKAETEYKPFNIHESINYTVDMLRHTIDPRIEMKIQLKADYSVIKGDAGQIQNCLLNMAINARDAMPEGGLLTFETETVRFDTESYQKLSSSGLSGPFIKISLKDTGMGMSEETKKRIFEPFYTTKEKGKGTGLGLSMVYGIIKQHNGHITFISESGRGSEFTIFLPLKTKRKRHDDVQIKEESVKGDGNILLIEDEQSIRESVSIALASLGYTVTCCSNGEEGVEYYQNKYHQTDIVILDTVMPKMNGLDCFRELKKINPAVPVIFASGYNAENDKLQMMGEGAVSFIKKPYTIEGLSCVLSGVMEKMVQD
jgi:signal transduction histidine kinase